MPLKNILILCDAFPPAFAPRMGYLCKYLPESGWDSIVITENISQHIFPELAKERKVTYIDFFYSKYAFIRKLKYGIVFLADFFFGYKDAVFYKAAQKQIENNNISFVLVSTYRSFPLKAAGKIAKKYNIPLIVDIRDIIEQFSNNEFVSKKFTNNQFINNRIAAAQKKRLIKERNNVLIQADFITTISPWHVNFLKQYNDKVALIYNGFDSELFFPKPITNEKFVITYTGRVINTQLRNPTMLFEAVSELDKRKKINISDFKICFYTDDKSKNAISELAASYHVQDYIEYRGYVSNKDIPDILNASSILLLLANKSSDDGPKGIMTTKLFEYLAVEKPILCVSNDESYLEEMIRETQSGLAANSSEEVCDFILEKYSEWKTTGFTKQQVNRDIIQHYSRKNQARQFVSIFNTLIT